MASLARCCQPTMGSESWKNHSLKALTYGQCAVDRSDRCCDLGRSADPLPLLRDVLASQSNEEIRRYSREVRVVAAKLRESLVETNEEVKALVRGKEALERTLEETRKDIQVNRDSRLGRASRPWLEKEPDGADDLLGAELAHLLNFKRSLEIELKTVQEHLQCLTSIRRRIDGCLHERTRVLDLICHSLAAVLQPEREILLLRNNRSQVEGRESMVDPGRLACVKPDALSPYTLEVDEVLGDASHARNQSASLRRDLRCVIANIEGRKQVAHKIVNEGLTHKVAETLSVKQHLSLGMGENRHALNRAQRWYDATERCLGYIQGSISYSDLTTRELLNRPLVTVFQRHTGTQLSEAQELVKEQNNLVKSLLATGSNLRLLKVAKKKLTEEKCSKTAAACVDSSVIRMRRSRADHRWSLGTAF